MTFPDTPAFLSASRHSSANNRNMISMTIFSLSIYHHFISCQSALCLEKCVCPESVLMFSVVPLKSARFRCVDVFNILFLKEKEVAFFNKQTNKQNNTNNNTNKNNANNHARNSSQSYRAEPTKTAVYTDFCSSPGLPWFEPNLFHI